MHAVIYHRVRVVIHAYDQLSEFRNLDSRLVVFDLQREDGEPYEHQVKRFCRADMPMVRRFITNCRKDGTIVHLQEFGS